MLAQAIPIYDRSKIEEVLSAVHGVTADQVVQISEHFAGYFDELGITILSGSRKLGGLE